MATETDDLESLPSIPGVEQHYSTRKVADLFEVSVPTIRSWLREGLINGRNINGKWRIPHSEVVRLGNSKYGRPGDPS